MGKSACARVHDDKVVTSTLVRCVDALVDADLLPGEYRQYLRGISYGDLICAVWRCPRCGALSSLGRRFHHVNHDGVVSPWSVCPQEVCRFQARIVLEGWVPEAVGRA